MTDHADSNVSDRELAEAENPAVGDGTPDDAPLVPTDPASFLRRYPVLVFALTLLLPAITAATIAAAEGKTGTAIVLAAVSAIVATLTPLVHRAVTPIAQPRLDRETPLVVATPPVAITNDELDLARKLVSQAIDALEQAHAAPGAATARQRLGGTLEELQATVGRPPS